MAPRLRPLRQAFGQRRLPVTIRPTKADVAIARIVARKTRPAPERFARALTWGADEKVLLALTAVGWLASRGAGEPMRRAANHAVLVAAAASLLPHGMKRLFDQTRPDRTTVLGHLHGVSFPASARMRFLPAMRFTWARWHPPRALCPWDLAGPFERSPSDCR
jgi:hypothetical protein